MGRCAAQPRRTRRALTLPWSAIRPGPVPGGTCRRACGCAPHAWCQSSSLSPLGRDPAWRRPFASPGRSRTGSGSPGRWTIRTGRPVPCGGCRWRCPSMMTARWPAKRTTPFFGVELQQLAHVQIVDLHAPLHRFGSAPGCCDGISRPASPLQLPWIKHFLVGPAIAGMIPDTDATRDKVVKMRGTQPTNHVKVSGKAGSRSRKSGAIGHEESSHETHRHVSDPGRRTHALALPAEIRQHDRAPERPGGGSEASSHADKRREDTMKIYFHGIPGGGPGPATASP